MNTGEVKTFNNSASVQSWTVPDSGTYLLKCYGANGGGGNGANGGYAYGNMKLTKGQILYIVTGGSGTRYTSEAKIAPGGYNGGGYGYSSRLNSDDYHGGGGGATHIALVSGTLKALGAANLSNILLVAGGGGGMGQYYYGGSGGGSSGGAPSGNSNINDCMGGTGGTQSGPGTSQIVNKLQSVAGFGYGGDTITVIAGGGGGGGLYGGGAGTNYNAGGGGSGYTNTSKLIAGSYGMTSGANATSGYANITLIAKASQLYWGSELVENLIYNGNTVSTCIYNGVTVFG